jgi:serine protease Do
MLKRAVECLRAGPAGWLLVLASFGGLALAWAAASPTNNTPAALVIRGQRPVSDVPLAFLLAAPKPVPGHRDALPAALSRAVPRSMADLRAIEQHVKKLVARVSPAVVAVEVGHASGSGVIISTNGLVLTAGHVCGEAGREVRFTFSDGRTARGKTLGVDLEADTGLMRITDRGSWPAASLGDLEHAEIGDWVLALGHPGGFDPRRSLVVRLGRLIRVTTDLLQTDCTISPGDSGGPLFDMQGRVIGIHSLISSSMAENFHVPITEYYSGWTSLVQVAAPRRK